MAESADATDLKSVGGDTVRVRPPLAPYCHCEECNDEAISKRDCHALRPEHRAAQGFRLAMTASCNLKCKLFLALRYRCFSQVPYPSAIDSGFSHSFNIWILTFELESLELFQNVFIVDLLQFLLMRRFLLGEDQKQFF